MKQFNKFKSSLIVCAVMAIASVAFADASVGTTVSRTYSYSTVALPFATLTGGGLAVDMSQTTTNLVSGWSTITAYTNTSVVWSNAAAAFTTNTTITYTTNTTYADFYALSPYVELQSKIRCNAANTSNFVATIIRSIDGTDFETTGVTVTNSAIGNTNKIALFQIDMGRCRYGRISSITWDTTNLAQILTNSFKASQAPW
jgi:hypothetical protein